MRTSSAATSPPALSTFVSCLFVRHGANTRRRCAGSTCVLRQRLRGLASTACAVITRLSARCETCCAIEYGIVNVKLASVCGYLTHSLHIAEILHVRHVFRAVNY